MQTLLDTSTRNCNSECRIHDSRIVIIAIVNVAHARRFRFPCLFPLLALSIRAGSSGDAGARQEQPS